MEVKVEEGNRWEKLKSVGKWGPE
ncbi:uncharacterized protein G2W53_035497 [Senna tora]|uniref:Uncharacterized protein n=1 Tax=Senna tora TaxID=362788 RepID=A0A834T3N3_9FABA|nr:uncharacterized protein G2W53_035497 [Senna tora]